MATTVRRLSSEDARVIGDAMFAMARADGQIDPREVDVIQRFLEECATGVSAISPGAPEGAALRKATEGLTDSFLCTCALLAFADGDFTAEEAVMLRRYATDVGVSDDRLDQLLRLVESEQPHHETATQMADLAEVLGGWSQEHLPSLREKVARFIGPARPR